MRTLILACFFISFGSVTHAQEPQAFPVPPGVTVVKHGWSKERIDWEFNPSRGSYGSADVRGPLNIHSQIAERERAVSHARHGRVMPSSTAPLSGTAGRKRSRLLPGIASSLTPGRGRN
jgi:hypothetical protein